MRLSSVSCAPLACASRRFPSPVGPSRKLYPVRGQSEAPSPPLTRPRAILSRRSRCYPRAAVPPRGPRRAGQETHIVIRPNSIANTLPSSSPAGGYPPFSWRCLRTRARSVIAAQAPPPPVRSAACRGDWVHRLARKPVRAANAAPSSRASTGRLALQVMPPRRGHTGSRRPWKIRLLLGIRSFSLLPDRYCPSVILFSPPRAVGNPASQLLNLLEQ